MRKNIDEYEEYLDHEDVGVDINDPSMYDESSDFVDQYGDNEDIDGKTLHQRQMLMKQRSAKQHLKELSKDTIDLSHWTRMHKNIKKPRTNI